MKNLCVRFLLLIAAVSSLVDHATAGSCDDFKPVGARCKQNKQCGSTGTTGCHQICGAQMKCCIVKYGHIKQSECADMTYDPKTRISSGFNKDKCCSGQCFSFATWAGPITYCRDDSQSWEMILAEINSTIVPSNSTVKP